MRERIKFIAVTTGPMEFVFYDLFTYRSKEFYKYTLYIFSRKSKSRFTGTNKNHIERSFLHMLK